MRGLVVLAVALMPGVAVAQPAGGSLMPCPDTAGGFEGACACWAPRAAPVWGTDLYTTDSAVCAAAVHGGAIAATGGTVRVTGAPGQARYVGSTRNGITSMDHGAAARSVRIERNTAGYGAPPGR